VTLKRVPIGGWKKCVHLAASFESKGEYAVAWTLDQAAAIVWWFRNDPPVLRIPTPAGFLEPDFVYLAKRDGREAMGALEVKGEIFWDGDGSDARIKAEAACEWVKIVSQSHKTKPWEFAVVLDQDAMAANSFEALRKVAVLACP
jgi:hypothetical protein